MWQYKSPLYRGPRDPWVHDYGNLDPFPPCFLTPQHVAEVAAEAVREGRGGLDLEFNPETGKPHIIGVASSSRAAACWFEDELATTFVRDMQHAGGQLVGHAVMDADKPIIDGWLGITTPVSLWDDSLLRGYLCNSDWCSMPGKDEDAADKGSLGFMGLYAMASYYLGLPNWKRCVSGETRVRLADGTERKISQLVQEQYAGEVQCVVNGYLTTRRVTDWHKSARSGRRMLQVSRTHAPEFRRSVVTEDHEFLTQDGWLQARDLTSSTLVATGEPGYSARYWDVVLACSLGDGHLDKTSPRLHVFNNTEHADYLEAKLSVLRGAFGSGTVTIYRPKPPKRVRSFSHWKSPSLSVFDVFRRDFAHDPTAWIKSYFSARAAAILFLDDGYMSKDGRAEVCLGLKSETLCSEICLAYRRLGVTGVVVKRPSQRVRRLEFNVVESAKLARLVAPYTPATMRYKLGRYYSDCEDFDITRWNAEQPEPFYDSVTVTPAPADQWTDTVYCLSVRDAENFIIPGGVVHNCRGSACFGPCPRHDEPWYCAVDSWAGLKIAERARQEMADRRISETLYEDLKRLAVYCGKMTRRGIRIDREVVNRLETGIQEKKGSLFESEMKLRTPKCKKLTKHWLTPFNPNAPKQIKEYFDSVGVELKAKKGSLTSKATICATLERELKKAKVPFTTDKVLGLPEIAEDWDGTLAEPVEYLLRLAEYKGAGKGLKSWFADEYIDTESFVHPRFIVPGTATGRLASANPNFQNLPKRGFGALVRAALVPRDSKLKFVRADKAQLELRVCLHYAGVDAPPFDAFSWLVEKAHGKFDAAAAKFSMKPRDIAKSVGHACLTPEHEVLTPQGWIRINAWDGDAIAEWRESGDIAFVVPRAYHRYQVDESLTWLHTRGLSQVVTNNHKLPVEITGTWNGKTYRTLHRQLPTELAHCGRIPVAGKLDARETFDDLTLRRAVCIQADGSRRGSGTWRFRFKRPRKIARFRELWPDAEFTWRGGVAEVTVDYTSPLLSLEKVLTWEFLRTSVRQKRLVCEEALYWDGTRRASTGQDCYTNSCRQSLDVLQTLAHLSGRQALLRNGSVGNFPGSTRRVDKLSFNVRRYAVVKTLERESVHYTGEVFCFTTSSGFFLVRHNNRISVTGNSNYLEGLMVFDDVELGSERRQTEIKEGALLVFDGKNGRPKWEYRGGIVCFSGANLAERLFGEKTRKARRDALAIQEIYFDAFPAIRAWHMELSHEVERSHSVRSITGRHMYLYGSPEEDLKLAAAFCGQGGGADEVQEGMLRYDDLGHVASIQVHDELGFEVPRDWNNDQVLKFFATFCEPSRRFSNWRFPIEVSEGLNYGGASTENPDGLRKLEKQIQL